MVNKNQVMNRIIRDEQVFEKACCLE